MSKIKCLASLRAADPKNFKSLKFIIELFGLKPQVWQHWENHLGDEMSFFDDGQKLNYKFKFKELNDLLQFSSLKFVIQNSKTAIVASKKKIIKAWILGQDDILRLFEYNGEWKSKHLFSETPALTLNIVNMFLGTSDNLMTSFRMDDFIILTPPFDSFTDYVDNENFSMLWKELEV